MRQDKARKRTAIERHLQASNEGYNAAHNGIPERFNPYESASLESEAWYRGHRSYHREARMNKRFREFMGQHSTREKERGDDAG